MLAHIHAAQEVECPGLETRFESQLVFFRHMYIAVAFSSFMCIPDIEQSVWYRVEIKFNISNLITHMWNIQRPYLTRPCTTSITSA